MGTCTLAICSVLKPILFVVTIAVPNAQIVDGYCDDASLTMAVIISITIYPSANNSCKQIGPRPGQMFVGPDLDPNCLILKLRFV